MPHHAVKVAVIIPDRGDRPDFMHQCLRLMERQTHQPTWVLPIDFKPDDNQVDITRRYRLGYQNASKHFDADVIAFIENDDYYHPKYLEFMVDHWVQHGKPDMLGMNRTLYYHIGQLRWFLSMHPVRSCNMNTLIKPRLPITWPVDNDPYCDVYLWQFGNQQLRKLLIQEPPLLCLGIKHGVGLCGGKHHINRMEMYTNYDRNMHMLKTIVDKTSMPFYEGLYLRLKKSS